MGTFSKVIGARGLRHRVQIRRKNRGKNQESRDSIPISPQSSFLAWKTSSSNQVYGPRIPALPPPFPVKDSWVFFARCKASTGQKITVTRARRPRADATRHSMVQPTR
jgi:hypothetical protein